MRTTNNFIFLITSSLLILSLHAVDDANCSPSACGAIRSISNPFRLNSDPIHCGHHNFELTCENNVTFFQLASIKYTVKSINYQNSTIRLVDASIHNDDICSFPITSSYYDSNECGELSVNLISCPNPLNNSSIFTDITQHCAFNLSHPGFSYVNVGNLMASEVPHMCTLDLTVGISGRGFMDRKKASLSEIHQHFLYGFEIQYGYNRYKKSTIWERLWNHILAPSRYLLIPLAILVMIIAGVSLPLTIIIGTAGLLLFSSATIWDDIEYYYYYQVRRYLNFRAFDESEVEHLELPALITGIIILAARIIICPLVFWFLICKFRRRHLSSFEVVELFLQSDNKLAPIRYSYSDIKKMTKNFKDKLGQGGFGSVYKGKLRSGNLVAVKLLGKSGANGQDFINEIGTIGRIHHVNIVQLVGYCAERSKRALVFYFMPNGSLDKYVFNREKAFSLEWKMKFKIAVEVARGIKYLHHGCDIQILHFDIKPHNILLDDKFIPKISDFGLAKLCSTNKETVTMTAARGTIGYVAPELINRSIGAVSYKADVYSFGMLLMEIVCLNKDLTRNNDESSKYFPNWIYDHLNQGRDIHIGNVDEEDDGKIGRKMTIVALWCIQMSPNNRPSMNKVLEMLEGDVENLQIPDYPTYMAGNEEGNWAIDSNASISLLHDNNDSSIIEIISNV